MYIHVDHRWIKTFLRKIISILLVYSLFFTNTAHAANVGGWNIGGLGVAQGASVIYEGTKQVIIDGKDYIKKGTAKITPPASAVAKVLARGAAAYALSVAVEQILGSVDWVLDPANNRIKYFDTNTAYCLQASPDICYSITEVSKLNEFCSVYNTYGGTYKFFKMQPTSASTSNLVCMNDEGYTQIPAVFITTTVEGVEKYLPLPVVAEKVISNAQANDKPAQVATGAAAADIVAEAETDQTGTKARPIAQQLENSASTKPADEAAADKANEATGEQTKNPDKPDTTDLKLTFPIFCNWAPTVCEAAQTVISFPKTLTNWWEIGKEKTEGWATSISESWTETKEWVKDDKKLDDADNDPPVIKDIPIGTLDTSAFKGTAGCPSPIQVPVAFAKSGNVEISYEPICAMASKWSFVAPFIGFFSGALIILGVGRKGEDSDT